MRRRRLSLETLHSRELFTGDLVAVDSTPATDDDGGKDEDKNEFHLHCYSDVACESLKTWCGKNDGTFIPLTPELGLCTTYDDGTDELEVPPTAPESLAGKQGDAAPDAQVVDAFMKELDATSKDDVLVSVPIMLSEDLVSRTVTFWPRIGHEVMVEF